MILSNHLNFDIYLLYEAKAGKWLNDTIGSLEKRSTPRVT